MMTSFHVSLTCTRPVIGTFSAEVPLHGIYLNKILNNQSRGWWNETPNRSCDVTLIQCYSNGRGWTWYSASIFFLQKMFTEYIPPGDHSPVTSCGLKLGPIRSCRYNTLRCMGCLVLSTALQRVSNIMLIKLAKSAHKCSPNCITMTP